MTSGYKTWGRLPIMAGGVMGAVILKTTDAG
jgi:hypothetical protein